MPPKEKKQQQPGDGERSPIAPRLPAWIWLVAFLLVILWWASAGRPPSGHSISYSDFKAFVARGEVTEVSVSPDTVSGELRLDPNATEPP